MGTMAGTIIMDTTTRVILRVHRIFQKNNIGRCRLRLQIPRMGLHGECDTYAPGQPNASYLPVEVGCTINNKSGVASSVVIQHTSAHSNKVDRFGNIWVIRVEH